ncbi:sodium-independent anion transporter [Funiculus sociatus GB2-M2]|uniref:sodium-independent anion transporter n=1 Tax=Cyanophyceae TaxID=3028117 RepID=UPI001F5533F9|nr:sodium-independent anion transporter [Trichocoleus sp. FACHB-90]
MKLTQLAEESCPLNLLISLRGCWTRSRPSHHRPGSISEPDSCRERYLNPGWGRHFAIPIVRPLELWSRQDYLSAMAIVKDYQVLVLDLSEVPSIGVTAALAIETMVEDAVKQQRHVWIVVTPGQVQRRIEKLKLQRFSAAANSLNGQTAAIPPQIYQLENRFQALQSALAIAQPEIPVTTTTIDP